MNFIDLFSGCGGFSLGLSWAGLNELAAIDFNDYAVKVFKSNFPETVNVINRDLRFFSPEKLKDIIGGKEVDLIVGGPPCQGFSTVRQRDGSNSGNRIIEDDRRELYQELLKYVRFFNPKIFVIENVLGIKSAAGGLFFNKVQAEGRNLGYRVHSEIIKSWEYGVPQKRQRQLIFGTRLDLPIFSSHLYMEKTHAFEAINKLQKIVTLGEAIGDLPSIEAGGGTEIMEYDLSLRNAHIDKYSSRYVIDVLQIDKSENLTAHKARPHSARDLRDFSRIREGETGAKALLRHVELEAPYDRSTFKDRYTKQCRDTLCSTIVAHLSKDGLMFIHPTQNRSLTPREAARIQSFPDTFLFPVSRTQQFMLIGNAVPPLIGKAVGLGIEEWFKKCNDAKLEICDQPENSKVAFQWMNELVTNWKNGNLASVPDEVLVKGWKGICYLFFDLHPDSIMENGKTIVGKLSKPRNMDTFMSKDYSLQIYEGSGWPVELVPYARETRRRFMRGEIKHDDYYCQSILINGYIHANRGKNGNQQNN